MPKELGYSDRRTCKEFCEYNVECLFETFTENISQNQEFSIENLVQLNIGNRELAQNFQNLNLMDKNQVLDI